MKTLILKNRPKGFRSSGIVIKNGKILLMRQIFKGEDFYNLPGGGLEENETLENACTREIHEEFNIHIKVGRLVYILDTPSRLNFIFECKYKNGKVALGGPEKARMKDDDQYFVEWVNLKNIKKINLQPEKTKEGILKYLKNKNKPTFYLNKIEK
jgi:ADP-ribose pyrophosphatase YjhB (NUDIX family)